MYTLSSYQEAQSLVYFAPWPTVLRYKVFHNWSKRSMGIVILRVVPYEIKFHT